MKNAILVYNPLSGHRSVPGKLDRIISRFMEKDILLQPYRVFNEAEGRLADVLEKGNYSFVIASGGDGTVNFVVNTMMHHGINLPLGIIPCGTCNDFARSLNIPTDLGKCLDIILGGKTLDIDVGLINEEKYFLETCAGGLFVDVSYSTSGDMKRNLGPFAYYLKALTEVATLKPIRLKIGTDKEVLEQDCLIFLILNGRTAAGFSNVIGQADISDGLMDVILIKNCAHIDLVGMLFKVLKNDLVSDRNVMQIRTKTCTIAGDSEIILSVDGEKWKGLPISVRFLHRAVKVFVR